MKLHKALALAALAGALAPAIAAQESYSGYFLDGNLYRNTMNPAFANDVNYVSMPVLGDMNFAMQGSLHLKNVIYNVNGRTTTFLNPAISAAEVMSHVHDANKVGVAANIPILSGGFKAWGGYNTVSIAAKVNVNTSVPGSLISFLKEGVENKSYDISDFVINANAYTELAFGHSREINKQWRVGGKLKFLIGGGNMDARLDHASLTLGQDSWDIVTNATVHSSVKGLRYKTKTNEHTGNTYVNDVDIDGGGLNGFGMAIDLGGEYRFNQDWTFSAAILDFGWISWGNDVVASTNGDKTFHTSRYTFNANEDAANSFDSEWKHMRDDLTALYELSDNGDQGGRSTMLNATVNLAAQYTFPLYRKLNFGLINSTHIAGKFTTTNFRLSANVAPVKIFSAGINMAVGTYGFDFGWMANLHLPKGFNMMLGMDHTLGKLAKQGVPLSSNGSFNFGINFPF